MIGVNVCAVNMTGHFVECINGIKASGYCVKDKYMELEEGGALQKNSCDGQSAQVDLPDC